MTTNQQTLSAMPQGRGNEPEYLQRYAELFQRSGQKSIKRDGILWTSYQKMIVPVGVVAGDYRIASEKTREDLLRYFNKCLLIRTGSGFVSSPEDWYAVICSCAPDISRYSAKLRTKLKRGLSTFSVRRVDARFIAEQGWPVYAAAFRRYKNTRLQETEETFKRDIMVTDGFEDIVHYWGSFEKATGRLVAFSKNYIYGKVEAYYWKTLFHPEYLRLHASFVLFYEMKRYYLADEKFAYVNDGFRSLLHETNIQDYLGRYFTCRNQPVGLQIFYRPLVGKCMQATYPYRNVLGKLYRPLDALYKLEEINREGFAATPAAIGAECKVANGVYYDGRPRDDTNGGKPNAVCPAAGSSGRNTISVKTFPPNAT